MNRRRVVEELDRGPGDDENSESAVQEQKQLIRKILGEGLGEGEAVNESWVNVVSRIAWVSSGLPEGVPVTVYDIPEEPDAPTDAILRSEIIMGVTSLLFPTNLEPSHNELPRILITDASSSNFTSLVLPNLDPECYSCVISAHELEQSAVDIFPASCIISHGVGDDVVHKARKILDTTANSTFRHKKCSECGHYQVANMLSKKCKKCKKRPEAWLSSPDSKIFYDGTAEELTVRRLGSNQSLVSISSKFFNSGVVVILRGAGNSVINGMTRVVNYSRMLRHKTSLLSSLKCKYRTVPFYSTTDCDLTSPLRILRQRTITKQPDISTVTLYNEPLYSFLDRLSHCDTEKVSCSRGYYANGFGMTFRINGGGDSGDTNSAESTASSISEAESFGEQSCILHDDSVPTSHEVSLSCCIPGCNSSVKLTDHLGTPTVYIPVKDLFQSALSGWRGCYQHCGHPLLDATMIFNLEHSNTPPQRSISISFERVKELGVRVPPLRTPEGNHCVLNFIRREYHELVEAVNDAYEKLFSCTDSEVVLRDMKETKETILHNISDLNISHRVDEEDVCLQECISVISSLNEVRLDLHSKLVTHSECCGNSDVALQSIPSSLFHIPQGVPALPFTVFVRPDEITSQIAFILCSVPHFKAMEMISQIGDAKRRVKPITSQGEDDWTRDELIGILKTDNTRNVVVKVNQLTCTVYAARQFAALRQLLGDEEAIITSLSRCKAFQPSGGKSGASFVKTLDGRYIAKELSGGQLEHFERISGEYFMYLAGSITKKVTSALAKFIGIFKIVRPGGETRIWALQENIFFGAPEVCPATASSSLLTGVFDLKGATRHRYADADSDVKMDSNFSASINKGKHVFLTKASAALLHKSCHNDSLMLSRCDIMDYSVLVCYWLLL